MLAMCQKHTADSQFFFLLLRLYKTHCVLHHCFCCEVRGALGSGGLQKTHEKKNEDRHSGFNVGPGSMETARQQNLNVLNLRRMQKI